MVTEPYRDCPRFMKCAVNNCPLHPQFPNLANSPLDKERWCTLAKSVRTKIASKYPGVLKYEGMTSHEAKGLKTWAAKSPTDKQKMIANGRLTLRTLRSQKDGPKNG